MDGAITNDRGASGRAMNKGQRTAIRILDVAEALFAEHGYGATSLRDIAEQAGLQQPGIYKHFAGKEELYRQVYERALQPMTALMDSILVSSSEEFGELTDRMIDLLAQRPNIARLLARVAISTAADPDPVGLAWLDQLVGYGRKLSEKASVSSPEGQLAIQTVGIFNILFGFFWASPLIERLAGKPAADGDMLATQKALVRRVLGAVGQPLRQGAEQAVAGDRLRGT